MIDATIALIVTVIQVVAGFWIALLVVGLIWYVLRKKVDNRGGL